jgi:cellulose synthase/poly-beta-1,6-N-acetylglucosamine synthase-like glycosyltransferase
MAKRLHAFLFPLHNEELVIYKTLYSLRKAGVAWEDMYFVDDGSTDKTVDILTKATFPHLSMFNVLCLTPNVGKTQALVVAFKHFNLAEKYEWVNTCDGDTLLSPDYLQKLIPILNDASTSTAAIASRVCSIKNSWNAYTSYRTWEYWLMQVTYKRAQGYINCITVLPGCGTTFRTSVFEKLSQDLKPEILTEDMLWTIRIHLEGLGRTLYAHSLRVYTQDPDRIKSYFKQNCRWFQGGWQVYRELKMWQVFKSKINAETSFLFLEGVFFSTLFTFAWLCLFKGWFPAFTHYFFWADCLLFTGLTLIGALCELDNRLILWMPFFYLLRILKCFIFLHSFIKIMIFKSDKRKKLLWNKVARY